MNIENFINLLQMQKSSFKEVMAQNNKNLSKQMNEEEAKSQLALHFNLVLMEEANNMLLESLKVKQDRWNGEDMKLVKFKPSTLEAIEEMGVWINEE